MTDGAIPRDQIDIGQAITHHLTSRQGGIRTTIGGTNARNNRIINITETCWARGTFRGTQRSAHQRFAIIGIGKCTIPSDAHGIRRVTDAVGRPEGGATRIIPQLLGPLPLEAYIDSPPNGLIVHGECRDILVPVPIKVPKLGLPRDLGGLQDLDETDLVERIQALESVLKGIDVKLAVTQIKTGGKVMGGHIAVDENAIFVCDEEVGTSDKLMLVLSKDPISIRIDRKLRLVHVPHVDVGRVNPHAKGS